jgi:superfamily II DNA or RNA helicase
VAADSEHARRIAAVLRQVTGRPPLVILHQDTKAAAKLAEFTRSSEPWIVAVNMVSEGVDIPRLRVGVYATAAKTPLIFRQIVGRFVRTIGGRPPEPSWLYVPADAVLRDHAANVESELRYLLRQRDGEDEGVQFEEVERRVSERGEVLDFEPLSADVAPQMTLFGPAAAAVPAAGTGNSGARAASAYVPPAGVTLTAASREVPLYERRAKLRAQRHRLVSDLARRDRTGQREINSWVNRELGIASVAKASIEELERSIEWLERRMAPRRR